MIVLCEMICDCMRVHFWAVGARWLMVCGDGGGVAGVVSVV